MEGRELYERSADNTLSLGRKMDGVYIIKPCGGMYPDNDTGLSGVFHKDNNTPWFISLQGVSYNLYEYTAVDAYYNPIML